MSPIPPSTAPPTAAARSVTLLACFAALVLSMGSATARPERARPERQRSEWHDRPLRINLAGHTGLPFGLMATLLRARSSTAPTTLHFTTRINLPPQQRATIPLSVLPALNGSLTVSPAGVGGHLSLVGDRALILAPDGDGVTRSRLVRLPPRLACDPLTAQRDPARLRVELAGFRLNPTGPLIPLRVLFVYTPSALVAAGGDFEHLRFCIGAAFAPTNTVFGDRPIGVALVMAGVVAVPTDTHDQPLRDVCLALGDAATNPLGRDAATLADLHDADLVCLITGPGRRTLRHAGHATIGGAFDSTIPAACVVGVHELRANDATLGHELAHVLGWTHPATRAGRRRSAVDYAPRRPLGSRDSGRAFTTGATWR